MEYRVIRDSDEELYHHGILGMKWGVRRYQNKDGSLTKAGQKRYQNEDGTLSKAGQKKYNKESEKLKKETAKVKAAEKAIANGKKTQTKFEKLEAKKQALEERKKALKDEKLGKKPNDEKEPAETPEQIRERLLKSNNAKEIYEHKDLLTTAELNDRINRIDTEARLQSKIIEEPQKTGSDYVNNLKNKIDTATNFYRSVDNAYSTVANSAIGKTLAKQLGIEVPKKEFNINEVWKNRNKLSTQELLDANKRLTAEDQIKKKMDERAQAKKDAEQAKADAKAAKKAAKEQEKVAKEQEKTTKKDSEKNTNDQAEKVQTDGKVYGEGTSRYTQKDNGPVYDAEYGRDYWDANTTTKNTSMSNLPSTEVYSRGQNYIAGYLEDRRR